MPTMRFVFLLAFSISFLPIFQAAAQVCPQRQLSQRANTQASKIEPTKRGNTQFAAL